MNTNDWIFVFDDDLMDEAAVRKSEVVEISAQGYIYTRNGHKYIFNCGYEDFMETM